MQEELELIKASNYAKNKGENYNNPETKEPISILELTSSNKYEDKFSVKDGELKYNVSALSDKEVEWCKELGISVAGHIIGTDGDGTTIEEGVLKGRYTGTGENIIISEEVTKIGDETFFENENLKELTIPDTVTSIGSKAFSGCTNLNLTIGENTSVSNTSIENIKSITCFYPVKNNNVIDFCTVYLNLLQSVGTITLKKCSITRENFQEYKEGLESGIYENDSVCNYIRLGEIINRIDNGTLVLLPE